MARVPRPNEPIDPAPIAPSYQRLDPNSAAFGSLQAQSLQGAAGTVGQLAGALGEQAIAQSTKRDAVARARDLGAFSTKAQDTLRTVQTERDMTDPATMTGFTADLDKLHEETLRNHTGGPDSRAHLAARLATQRTEILGHATGLAHTAQETMVAETVATSLQPVTAEAYSNPGDIESLMKRADGVIADMMPALGVNKAQALTNSARQEVVKSAIQSLIDTGQVEAAGKAVGTYGSLLTPANQRSLNQHITIARVSADKAKNAANAVIAQATQILGRPPTPEEAKVLIGLAKPHDPNVQKTKPYVSPSEVIAGFEKATGKLATDEQKAIAFGLAKPSYNGAGGAFGNSLRGRSLSIADDNVVGFANGLLAPEEERTFLSAVTQLQTPFTRPNPETGALEQVTAPLPPQIVEAFRQRNMPLPAGTGAPVLPNGGAPASREPAPAAPAAPAPAAPAAPAPAAPNGHQSIWTLNSKNLITGPAPALGEAARRTPGVGGMLPGAENTQARNYVELASRQLVQALQTNKNYAVKEMQGIEKDIDLRPSLHDSSDAYADRLIAVDTALAQREAHALKRSDPSSGLHIEFRKEARNVANLIAEFRETLGVPPILSPKDAEVLPDGAQFRTKDGRIMTRRRGPAAGGN